MKNCVYCGGEIPQHYIDKGFIACKARCQRKYEGFLKEKLKNPDDVFHRIDSKLKKTSQ